MAPFPGGVLLQCAESKETLGAVGISGASADEDEYCALEGVNVLGADLHLALETVPTSHSCSTISPQ